MIRLRVPDVGSGLSASFEAIPQCAVQIDCGALDAKRAYLKGPATVFPSSLILSHFHEDHFNGFVHALENSDVYQSQRHLCQLEHVYFPRVPEFPRRDEFMNLLTAMNRYLIGDLTGSKEADILSIIRQIKQTPELKFTLLSQGDNVTIDENRIEVLWPPEHPWPGKVPASVLRAIRDSEAALEDPEFRSVYEKVRSGEPWRMYASEKREAIHWETDGKIDISSLKEKRELPPSVATASKSLRDAANRISLAFRVEDRLLFMGDLHRPEIKRVVDWLEKGEFTAFETCIAPHHGTHWHDDLRRLRFHNIISSVGKNLVPKVREEYKCALWSHFSTFSNGDLQLGFSPYRHTPCCVCW